MKTDVDLTDWLYLAAGTVLIGLITGACALGWWLAGWSDAFLGGFCAIALLSILSYRAEAKEREIQAAYDRGYTAGRRDGYTAGRGFGHQVAATAAEFEPAAPEDPEVALPGVRSRTSILAG